MAQAQLNRVRTKEMFVNTHEDLRVKVTNQKKEGTCITIISGNKRIKLPLDLWWDLMAHRSQIGLASDFVRGLVGAEWSMICQEDLMVERPDEACTEPAPLAEQTAQMKDCPQPTWKELDPYGSLEVGTQSMEDSSPTDTS